MVNTIVLEALLVPILEFMCLDIHCSHLWVDLCPLHNCFAIFGLCPTHVICKERQTTCPSHPSQYPLSLSPKVCWCHSLSHDHLSCLHFGHAATPLTAVAMAARFHKWSVQLTEEFRPRTLCRRTSATTVSQSMTCWSRLMSMIILWTSAVTQLFIYYGKV